MSIVPAARLSASELSMLGNNIRPLGRRRRPRPKYHRPLLSAVNRSLAVVGERISTLHWPQALAS